MFSRSMLDSLHPVSGSYESSFPGLCLLLTSRHLNERPSRQSIIIYISALILPGSDLGKLCRHVTSHEVRNSGRRFCQCSIPSRVDMVSQFGRSGKRIASHKKNGLSAVIGLSVTFGINGQPIWTLGTRPDDRRSVHVSGWRAAGVFLMPVRVRWFLHFTLGIQCYAGAGGSF
jgi:hypothetical protein